MEEEIKKLIQQNTKLTRENAKLTKHIHDLTEEIHHMTKKIRSHVVLSEILGFIKFLIIFIPIILGIIYLPPIVKEAFEKYTSFFNIDASNGDALQSLFIPQANDTENPNNMGLPNDLLNILNNIR